VAEQEEEDEERESLLQSKFQPRKQLFLLELQPSDRYENKDQD
jgi:hypothetical protein